MAYIHVEVDDELHHALKVAALARRETVTDAIRRLAQWYVDGADTALLELYVTTKEAVETQYLTDEGWYMPWDDAIALSRAVVELNDIPLLADAAREEG